MALECILLVPDMENRTDVKKRLQAAGRVHDAHDIAEEHYEIFVENLIDAVKQNDKQWGETLEAEWREMLQMAVRVMRSKD